MSLVHIRLTQHDASTGTDVGVVGAVRAVPTRRYSTNDKHIVLPSALEVKLDEHGEAWLELTPTTADFAWRVSELVRYGAVRTVLVPDSSTVLEYADLQDVALENASDEAAADEAHKSAAEAAKSAAEAAEALKEAQAIAKTPGPKGEKGDPGPQGEPGKDATVAVATADAAGIVKPGNGLSVDTDGTLNATAGGARKHSIDEIYYHFDTGSSRINAATVIDGGNTKFSDLRVGDLIYYTNAVVMVTSVNSSTASVFKLGPTIDYDPAINGVSLNDIRLTDCTISANALRKKKTIIISGWCVETQSVNFTKSVYITFGGSGTPEPFASASSVSISIYVDSQKVVSGTASGADLILEGDGSGSDTALSGRYIKISITAA